VWANLSVRGLTDPKCHTKITPSAQNPQNNHLFARNGIGDCCAAFDTDDAQAGSHLAAWSAAQWKVAQALARRQQVLNIAIRSRLTRQRQKVVVPVPDVMLGSRQIAKPVSQDRFPALRAFICAVRLART
jgi:hypothetical protein